MPLCSQLHCCASTAVLPVIVDVAARQCLRLTSAASRPRRRREMEAGQAADHLPQPLFGKRALQVVGAQARFDVRDRDRGCRSAASAPRNALSVSPCTTTADHGCRVITASSCWRQPTLNSDSVVPCALQRDVRHDVEAGQDLLRHLAVLTGVQPLHAASMRRPQRVIDRRELDDFRPRSRHEQDLFHSTRFSSRSRQTPSETRDASHVVRRIVNGYKSDARRSRGAIRCGDWSCRISVS